MSYILNMQTTESGDDFQKRLEEQANKLSGRYPRTIFIGIGGTGAKSLLALRRRIIERFGSLEKLPGIAFLSFDSDVNSTEESATAKAKGDPFEKMVALERGKERLDVTAHVDTYIGGDNLLKYPNIRDWWDKSTFTSINISQGLGQIRPLSRLTFFANENAIRTMLVAARSRITEISDTNSKVDTNSAIRVVIVAGWAGGTGSGMFLDMGAMVRRVFPKGQCKIDGFFVLPSATSRQDNTGKTAANGFAALRELNHYLSSPFDTRWTPQSDDEPVRGLYDRYIIISGTNHTGEEIASADSLYQMLGDTLFLDFSADAFSGWIQGVRVNREQYLSSYISYEYQIPSLRGNQTTEKTHAEKWNTQFSSLGMAKLVAPSWRLLNQCRYRLASGMASMLRQKEVANIGSGEIYQSKFLSDLGILIGELPDFDEFNRPIPGTNKPYNDIIKNLSAMSAERFQSSDLSSAINNMLDGLVLDAMFDEKNTDDTVKQILRRFDDNIGDIQSGVERRLGTWTKSIQDNRIKLVNQIRDRLPQVMEVFRSYPELGISGLAMILRRIYEFITQEGKPYQRFREESGRLPTITQDCKEKLEQETVRAHRASTGFFAKKENFQVALEQLRETFRMYMHSKLNEFLYAEAAKAVEEIVKLFAQQCSRLDNIGEKIFSLQSYYELCAKSFENASNSPLIIELPIKTSDPLLYYLTDDPQKRNKRMENIFTKFFERVKIKTLDQLEEELEKRKDNFRDELSAMTFFVLRGESGKTSYFDDDQNSEPLQGFIERFSAANILNELGDYERGDLLEKLYRRGMPWMRINQTNEANATTKTLPFGDFFIAYNRPPGDLKYNIQRYIKNKEPQHNVQEVKIADPSEIILYTEFNAFPAFSIEDIYSGGMYSQYRNILYDKTKVNPLHLHRDYHNFPEVIPLSMQAVAQRLSNWQLLIRALMLGIVRSIPQDPDSKDRFFFERRKQETRFNVSWENLGVTADILYRMEREPSFITEINRLIEQLETKLQQQRNDLYAHLAALADYYFYCIFPVARDANSKGPKGSLGNLVCARLRNEWREKYKKTKNYSEDLVEEKIQECILQLAEWALPSSKLAEWPIPVHRRDIAIPVPYTKPIDESLRNNAWTLIDKVTDQVQLFQERGLVPEYRDEQGNIFYPYPWLMLNLPFFEKAVSMYFYAVNGETQKEKFSASDIARRYHEKRELKHYVYQEAKATWIEALEEIEIKQEYEKLQRSSVGSAPPPPPMMAPPMMVSENMPVVSMGFGNTPMPMNPATSGILPPAPGPLVSSAASNSSQSVVPAFVSGDVLPTVQLKASISVKTPAAVVTLSTYHYACGRDNLGQKAGTEIVELYLAKPNAEHKVWRKELGGWKKVMEVDELRNEVERLSTDIPPPLDDDMPPPL